MRRIVLAFGSAGRRAGGHRDRRRVEQGRQPVAGRLLDAARRCTGRSSRRGSRPPTARASPSPSRTAASTDQARAVAAGLKADLVFLSTGDDVNMLVDAGLVDPNWDKQSYKGIEADTVVVFAVRNGNPKHIKSWADLVKPGVQVITPNPFSSGSAKWNILAAYGAQRRLGKTDEQAQALRQAALPARRLAGHVRPERDQHVPVRQGRRPAHLRERGARPRARPGPTSST